MERLVTDFEHKSEPLISVRAFRLRLARSLVAGGVLVVGSLCAGACGYRWFEGMRWLDATLNAAMILTGMGPVEPLHTQGGKIFAICYSLFSGVVFLTVAAFVLAPIGHRMLHRLHLEMEED